MSTTLRDVIQFISSCSKIDRKAIVAELNFQTALERDKARAQFRVGDRVMFQVSKRPHYGSVIRGVIVKKNPTTFHVRPDGGGREWRVAIGLIQKDESPTD